MAFSAGPKRSWMDRVKMDKRLSDEELLNILLYDEIPSDVDSNIDSDHDNDEDFQLENSNTDDNVPIFDITLPDTIIDDNEQPTSPATVQPLTDNIAASSLSGTPKVGQQQFGRILLVEKEDKQPTTAANPTQTAISTISNVVRVVLGQRTKDWRPCWIGSARRQPAWWQHPIGFEHYNNRQPSAPLPPGHQPTGGLGSAFGGAKPNNPPYPTHNNPGGFGSNPGGFGSNPGGFGSNTGHHPQGGYNSPGGFGSNTGGFGHNQGGFGSNTGHHPQGGYNSPGGFGGNTGGFGGNTGGFGGNTGGFGHNQGGFGSNTGGHHPQGGYNAPGGGFGGTHHNSQPGYGNQPHYNQPGGYHGGQQHGYGGGAPGYHPPANSYGSYPAGYGGQPHYGGGHSPQYNPGGFGGGYHPSGGYGGYGGQGYMPGGKVKSGPGIGTGLLGGAAAALPLGLLVGYGLGSMGSHSSPFSGSSHSAAPASPAAAAAPANNDAFNEWLKQRTAEEKKKEEAAIAAGAVAGGAAAAGAAGAASSVLINKDGVTTVNETALVSRILEQTSMCPGGAGILEASFLNTLVPCNATEVDFQETNLTIPYEDDCKTIKMTLIQLNPTTNENKSVSLTIKQINVESGLPGDLATTDCQAVD
ncbi:nuclear pore complex protein NUP214-like [Nilaparvata lugens]|uniref:nuclear pore complex protein NUP214-like n=1 Tax=Nilaparvata lugens TaxID=108931 RepID=UPI00193CAD25|nr:nuclear pore complex protein NUP214-like [Nilaparvata lugens]